MQPYKNLCGRSAVTHYEIQDDRILILFKNNPDIYIYPEYLTGSEHFKNLKSCAINGSGLGAYIMNNVKSKFIK